MGDDLQSLELWVALWYGAPVRENDHSNSTRRAPQGTRQTEQVWGRGADIVGDFRPLDDNRGPEHSIGVIQRGRISNKDATAAIHSTVRTLADKARWSSHCGSVTSR